MKIEDCFLYHSLLTKRHEISVLQTTFLNLVTPENQINVCFIYLISWILCKPPVAFPWSQCSVSWAWLFQDLHHSRPHSNLGQARATTRELFPWMTWGCQTCFYWFILMVLIFFKWSWGFASSPVVRTLHFHCRGHRFDLVGELRSCMLHGGAKNYLHFTFIIYINKNR